MTGMKLIKPGIIPPLDPGFRPAALANRAFAQDVAALQGEDVPLIIALERSIGCVTRYETRLFPADHPRYFENLFYAERILKFLLWQCGGWKVYLHAPSPVVNYIQETYSHSGSRAFDHQFMGADVYQHPFCVIACAPDEVPPAREVGQSVGRHLDGCRIGFDLGASDLKVSAVSQGNAVFSEEIVWQPRLNADPNYHYEHINTALKMAAGKLPRVDAIGGSSAGVVIANRIMIASLFRSVPRERFDEARNIFLRLRDEWGVPLEVANDGEVTALAGSMSLDVNAILGTALGSSQAAGFVTRSGNLTDWLNELAFAPVDYSPDAPVDEWSGDRGVGALYFSQQCVFRLAPIASIEIPSGMIDADKLKFVQEKLESGHPGAADIWKTMGVYMGYGIAHYANFYDLEHVLILGRCTSGSGGGIILDTARQVINQEFPELATRINLHLPDERSRRVGQSIAAASLPALL